MQTIPFSHITLRIMAFIAASCVLLAGTLTLDAEEIFIGPSNPQGDPSVVIRVSAPEAFRVAVAKFPDRAAELAAAARAAAEAPSVAVIMDQLKPLDAEIRRLIAQADGLRMQADLAIEREMAVRHADAYALLSETRLAMEKERGQTDENARLVAAEREMLLKGDIPAVPKAPQAPQAPQASEPPQASETSE